MAYKRHEWEGPIVSTETRTAQRLLGPAQCGATHGLALGVAVYTSDTYGAEDNHEQEAVYVVSGRGVLRTGDTEIPLVPGDVIYLPAGEPHTLRKVGPEPLKLVWAKAGGSEG